MGITMTMPHVVHLMSLACLTGLLLSAAVNDVRSYRIPNSYSLALVALYPVFAATAPQSVAPLASIGVSAMVLVIGVAAFSLRLIGGGDAKLLSVTALFAGPALILDFLFVTALSGALLALLMWCQPLRSNLAAVFGRVGNHALREAPLAESLPYGAAIAVGGVYLVLRLCSIAIDAA